MLRFDGEAIGVWRPDSSISSSSLSVRSTVRFLDWEDFHGAGLRWGVEGGVR